MNNVKPEDNWDQLWEKYGTRSDTIPGPLMRYSWMISQLKKLTKGEASPTILDIGCGTGEFLKRLRDEIPHAILYGTDYSIEGVTRAKAKVQNLKAVDHNLLDGPVTLSNDWTPSDYAVCSEVLEHVDNPERLLINARPMMSKNAYLIVTVPGGGMSNFDKHLGHRQHFKPKDLDDLMGSVGFQKIWSRTIGFPFFNLYKFVVILNSTRVKRMASKAPGLLELLALKAFVILFKANINFGPLGFQTVGLYKKDENYV